MTFWCHSRTACSIYYDRDLRKGCFYQKCIGNHTDICAESNKCNTSYIIIDIHCHQFICQICRTKSIFINRFCFSELIQFTSDLPSFCIPDAVWYWKFLSLLSIQIPCFMSISCKKNGSFKISDFLLYFGNNCDSFFCPKSAYLPQLKYPA